MRLAVARSLPAPAARPLVFSARRPDGRLMGPEDIKRMKGCGINARKIGDDQCDENDSDGSGSVIMAATKTTTLATLVMLMMSRE